MRISGRIIAGFVVLLTASSLAGANGIAWQPNIQTASRQAAHSGRLVLAYFWGPYCGYCKQMEREAFADPGVVGVVSHRYVPVKINQAQAPEMAANLGVQGLPTTLVLSPDGQVIDRIQGRVAAADLAGRLGQVAARQTRPVANRPSPAGSHLASNRPPAQAGPRPTVPARPTATQPNWQQQRTSGPIGGDYQPNPTAPAQPQAPPTDRPRFTQGSTRTGDAYNLPPRGAPSRPAPTQPVASAQRSAPYARPEATRPPAEGLAGNRASGSSGFEFDGRQIPAPQADEAAKQGNPPLALDGYCAVSLIDDLKSNRSRWTIGSKEHGIIHRGRTYLFADAEKARRFFQDPDRYAPVLSGSDVVVATSEGRLVSGQREHGAFFGNRIYLFSSEDTLREFENNPNRYAGAAYQAMRSGAVGGSRLR
jgi:YHS domain-containing protein/thiol-disulfide isomerase/thioredoxin